MTDDSAISARGIPGLQQSPNRGYLYLEVPTKAAMKKFLRKTDDDIPDVPSPRSGGMLTENIVITTPDKRAFSGLSFQGDLPGWDGFLRAHAKRLAIGIAVIDPGRAEIVYEGGSCSLAGCVIAYY